jgi:hypothetical protein
MSKFPPTLCHISSTDGFEVWGSSTDGFEAGGSLRNFLQK